MDNELRRFQAVSWAWHAPCLKPGVRFWFASFVLLAAQLLQAEPLNPAVLAELPLRFEEGLLWLEVKRSDNDEPLQFLLDSGASCSVLNLETAQNLRLKLGGKVSVAAVGTEAPGFWPVKFSAKVGSVQLPRDYLVLDLNKLSRQCGHSVDGLIGGDFFRNRFVQIDYAAQKLRILKSIGKVHSAVPLELRSCGFRIQATVNGGAPQWLRLDTGCATALQWVTSKVAFDNCTRLPAVGLTELSIPQTTTSIRVGNHYSDAVPTGLHRQAIFPGESGLLGNGFLAMFRSITIDGRSGQLILGSETNSRERHSPARGCDHGSSRFPVLESPEN